MLERDLVHIGAHNQSLLKIAPSSFLLSRGMVIIDPAAREGDRFSIINQVINIHRKLLSPSCMVRVSGILLDFRIVRIFDNELNNYGFQTIFEFIK